MELDLKKIKQLRIKNKLSLKDLALYLGYVTPTGYYYAESGRCSFKPHHISMLAQKYGVPMDTLFLRSKIAKLAK